MNRTPYSQLFSSRPLGRRTVQWLVVLWACWLPAILGAQVIDESTSQDSFFVGVGTLNNDYVAQSFLANITQVDSIGVWLRRDSGNARVRLLLTGDNGVNRPDLGTILYSSNPISPVDSGSWHYESGFTTILEPGRKYWVVVDGFNELGATGFAAIGTSNAFTDSGDPLFFSSDGGIFWTPANNLPMAVLVAGDTCRFSVPVNPAQPVLCPGETITLSAPTGFLSYSWSTTATASGITVDQTGFYTVSVIRSDLCVGTGSVTVVPGTIPFTNLDTSYTICAGDSIGLSVIPFFNSYEWSTGSTLNVETISEPGIYWVEVISAAGCVTRDSTILINNPLPDVSLGADTSLCAGDFIFLDAGAGFAAYAWSNGQSGRSVFIDITDSVWVTLTDSNNCVNNSDTVTVTVNPNPVVPSVTQEFNGLVSSFAQGYQWFLGGFALGDGTEQLYPDPPPGEYFVVVRNGFGCSAMSDTITVFEGPVGNFVSQGFSPNGDGLNEVFFVEGVSRFPNNLLIVYNREGNEVYRQQSYANDWDGTNSNGQPLPDGNYFYYLDLGQGDSPRRGVVLIHR